MTGSFPAGGRLHCAARDRTGQEKPRASKPSAAFCTSRPGGSSTATTSRTSSRAEWFVAGWRWCRNCAELLPNFSVHEGRCLPKPRSPPWRAIAFETVYDLFPRLAERRGAACRLATPRRRAGGISRWTAHDPKVVLLTNRPTSFAIVRAFVNAVKRSPPTPACHPAGGQPGWGWREFPHPRRPCCRRMSCGAVPTPRGPPAMRRNSPSLLHNLSPKHQPSFQREENLNL